MKILNKSIKQPEIATFWPPDETAPSQLNCELDIRAGWESKLLKHVPIQLDSFKKQDLGQQTKFLAKIKNLNKLLYMQMKGHYPQMEDPFAVIEHYKTFLSIT